MPELISILAAKRDKEHQDRKFSAALVGHDLDGDGGEAGEDPNKAWADMKARVFSGGKAKDSSDIVSLQGQNAADAGFGIGDGLGYESVGDEGVFSI